MLLLLMLQQDAALTGCWWYLVLFASDTMYHWLMTGIVAAQSEQLLLL